MCSANLGTKRQCPKCGAKFYDFGKADPITCPKCGKAWKEAPPKPGKTIKPKKEAPKPKRKLVEDDEIAGGLPDMPEVEGDDSIEELEPVEDDEVELTSLEEVEEHEEEEEADPNSDDADDEMFTEMVGEEKLVDDLEDHIETDEDHDDEDEDEEPSDEDDGDEDEDDDTPKKKKRRK